MEHRLHKRYEAGISAQVSLRGSALADAVMENVSARGMLIRTQGQRLRRHQLVNVQFRLPLEGGVRVFQVKAMVVRLTETGAGLEALDYGMGAHPALNTLVDYLRYHAEAPMRAVG